jgi:hypothetical protein
VVCSAALGFVLEDEQRMFYDALSLFEAEYASNIQQSGVAGLNANYEHTAPRIEMLVGPWYLDEFGNPTRQIKARD